MMLEKLKQVGNAAKDVVTKTAIQLGDFNGVGILSAISLFVFGVPGSPRAYWCRLEPYSSCWQPRKPSL
jgi:hypothetical protein